MDALYSKILVFHFFMKSLTKHCGFVPLRPFQLMSRERDITMYCPPLTRKDLNLRVSIESLFPGITVRQKKKKKKKKIAVTVNKRTLSLLLSLSTCSQFS